MLAVFGLRGEAAQSQVKSRQDGRSQRDVQNAVVDSAPENRDRRQEQGSRRRRVRNKPASVELRQVEERRDGLGNVQPAVQQRLGQRDMFVRGTGDQTRPGQQPIDSQTGQVKKQKGSVWSGGQAVFCRT